MIFYELELDPPARRPAHSGVDHAAAKPQTCRPAAHGPRAVVLGFGSALEGSNWAETAAMHGTAYLVDSAIGWLAAQPAITDIPDRGVVTAGIRITEESRTAIRNYVLIYMPLAALALGAAIGFWRRSTEGASRKPRRG